jgi:hypothetical protein
MTEMTDRPAARAEPARCAGCGSVVANAVEDRTVVTVGEVKVLFRRHTDHVVCPYCMASYRITSLRSSAPAL